MIERHCNCCPEKCLQQDRRQKNLLNFLDTDLQLWHAGSDCDDFLQVHLTMRGVLEESRQRHKHSVKKMEHTWYIRSVLNAVLVIQRHFRAWQHRRRMQPLIEQEKLQHRQREQWAATVIQRAWRNYHGRKIMRSAKKLLRNKQRNAILRVSGHDWKCPPPSYAKKTLISGKVISVHIASFEYHFHSCMV